MLQWETAKAIGIGEAGPSGEWHRDQVDEGWSELHSKGMFELSELAIFP